MSPSAEYKGHTHLSTMISGPTMSGVVAGRKATALVLLLGGVGTGEGASGSTVSALALAFRGGDSVPQPGACVEPAPPRWGPPNRQRGPSSTSSIASKASDFFSQKGDEKRTERRKQEQEKKREKGKKKERKRKKKRKERKKGKKEKRKKEKNLLFLYSFFLRAFLSFLCLDRMLGLTFGWWLFPQSCCAGAWRRATLMGAWMAPLPLLTPRRVSIGGRRAGGGARLLRSTDASSPPAGFLSGAQRPSALPGVYKETRESRACLLWRSYRPRARSDSSALCRS
ncbi:unnamed protein product [Ostreobium quekettii]|uniref:Uncharacterized protein n=1 Tax=Ostreobium quekettii TaxID=121088 RepID=A0A8S1IKI4_9CHLO|nr:unnamed protein product [Ostreobium quekettii]